MQPGKDKDDIGHAVVSCSQPRDKLGVGRSKDVEVPTMVWQADDDRAEKNKSGGWEGSEMDNGGQREKEVKENRRKVEDMVPKRFHKWLKVFGKQESKRMPVRKTWNHAIDLQEEFVPRKGRIYPLCYDSELLTRSNCDRNSRQPCILSSPPVRGSG